MKNYKGELKKITEILLKEEDDYLELTGAIDQFFELFKEVAELKVEDDEARKDIFLSGGKAIGTTWAALCVKEIIRTKRFIKGIFKGIKAAQGRFKGQTVNILYAGTGPFATLAMPMTALFSSEDIQFTFLEINHNSINMLKKVIVAFEAGDYVKDIIECDAMTYKHHGQQPIHMVITETMLNALVKEPQVGITMNLVPQMVEGGILIPQSIKVDAALLSPKKTMERHMDANNNDHDYCHTMHRIFEFNKELALQKPITNLENGTGYSFEKVKVEFPEDISEEYKQIRLMTTIQVFEDVLLTPWQCSLTLPYKVGDIDWSNPLKEMTFQYIVNEKPGFRWKPQIIRKKVI